MNYHKLFHRLLIVAFLALPVMQLQAQEEIPVHNIENRPVQRYLNEVTYDYYSEEFVGEYVIDKTVEFERSAPFVVTLPHPTDTIAYLYYNIKDEKVDSICVNEGETEVKLYNLYPGKDYEYSITMGEDTIAGGFKTVGRVRMIAFPTLYNTRDLGGWRIGDGKMIRYGMLYRGIELHRGHNNKADSATVAGLKALGIAAELDMRRTFYLEQYSDMSPNVVPDTSAFGKEVPYTFLNLTSVDGMLTSYGTKFRDGLRFVIDNICNDRPVYFHCVWGADRTGLLAAIIESVLGVSLEDVYKEYGLTSFSTYSGLRDKSSINIRLLDKIGYDPESEETLQECCTNYVVNTLGIPLSDIEMLREKLIVDDDLPVIEYEPDVPTEIGGVKNEERRVKNLNYFNLTGQRILNPYHKGIIISNGKKYANTVVR